MSTPRQVARDAFMTRLLEVAKAQLAQVGAAGLGMRSLARELQVTPGALYRYIAGRDDLLTLLVIDAYSALGSAAEQAERRVPREDLQARWLAVFRAVREWAVTHRHEYALIYGTPVPGYQAPPETIQPASGITLLLARIAFDHGRSSTRASGNDENYSEGLRQDVDRIRQWSTQQGMTGEIDGEAILGVVRAWSELIGSISLELFGHYVGSVEHPGDYLDEIANRTFAAL